MYCISYIHHLTCITDPASITPHASQILYPSSHMLTCITDPVSIIPHASQILYPSSHMCRRPCIDHPTRVADLVSIIPHVPQTLQSLPPCWREVTRRCPSWAQRTRFDAWPDILPTLRPDFVEVGSWWVGGWSAVARARFRGDILYVYVFSIFAKISPGVGFSMDCALNQPGMSSSMIDEG